MPPSIDAVYDDLRRLARVYTAREQHRSVQATELVHDAYLRMAQTPGAAWDNRTQFVAFAAIAMRRLLVERARARRAAKRGGGAARVTFDESLPVSGAPPDVDVVMLDEALTRLAAINSDHARVVELRYFGGLTIDETAEAMQISPATVKRQWAAARAWLFRELERATP